MERRLIALRQATLGRAAKEVADTVNEKTIREWVAAFNEEGASSLRYDKYKGKIPRLTKVVVETMSGQSGVAGLSARHEVNEKRIHELTTR